MKNIWVKIAILTQAPFCPYPTFTILHSGLLRYGFHPYKVQQIYPNLYRPYLSKGVPNSEKSATQSV